MMLEYLERSLNSSLTRLVTSNLYGNSHASINSIDSKQNARIVRIMSCSRRWSDYLAAVVSNCARSSSIGNNLILKTSFSDVDDQLKLDVDVQTASCLLVCWDDITIAKDENQEKKKLLHIFTNVVLSAIMQRVNFLVLVASPSHNSTNHRSSDIEGTNRGIQDTETVLQWLLQQIPELICVQNSSRLQSITMNENKKCSERIEIIIQQWLQDSLPQPEPLANLSYRDIWQIISRQLSEQGPSLQALIRLGTMCFLGILCVLITLFFIAYSSNAQREVTNDVVSTLDYVRRVLEAQRTGKSEWGWRQNAVCLGALQLNQPQWFLLSPENTRSIDRLEISLLALLSRCKRQEDQHLGPLLLSQYILALTASFLNARDFHGHDLPSTLDAYITERGTYHDTSAYTLSLAAIALHNAYFPLKQQFFDAIIKKQRRDGSFPLGMDEAVMSLMALSLSSSDESRVARQRTEQYIINSTLITQANNLHTLALILQAANARVLNLTTEQNAATLQWIIATVEQNKKHISNVDIASHVLIALSGKSILHSRQRTDLENIGSKRKVSGHDNHQTGETDNEAVKRVLMNKQTHKFMTSDEMMSSALVPSNLTSSNDTLHTSLIN